MPDDTRNELKLAEGGLAVDDRGSVAFVNGFDFAGVKRFYSVTNHQPRFIRAWHAHRRESKYVYVSAGSAVVGAVRIDNWELPDAGLAPSRYVLSAARPSVLYIPAGHANGFMTLTADTTVLFFSTSSLAESLGDDVRYPARYWDIWQVEER
ncbi:MAG: dTDP-4-dehydrorhamnose 3,5-epimerase family protein [Acidobacteria bacterium]|nr:dTDP-4-dehydrorhamnose 3,5-epimerase family protein [Acidobacteriota bacterium]